MAQNAKVRSIEAIDAFRTRLLLFRERAVHVLDEVQGEVVRTRSWLEGECLMQWRRRLHVRNQLLAQAQQELLTARLSINQGAIQDRRMAVRRAQDAVREAEAGVARVHHWLRHYETEVESRAKPALRLRQTLDAEVRSALGFLKETVDILSDYAAMKPTPSPDPAAASQPGVAAPQDASPSTQETRP